MITAIAVFGSDCADVVGEGKATDHKSSQQSAGWASEKKQNVNCYMKMLKNIQEPK
jgi:hypothetical protein